MQIDARTAIISQALADGMDLPLGMVDCVRAARTCSLKALQKRNTEQISISDFF